MVDDSIPIAEITENPYNEDSVPTAPIAQYNIDDIPSERYKAVKKCYGLSIAVKHMAWIEGLVSTLYAFGDLYFAIPLFLTYMGYMGAKNFNKNLTVMYFIYLISINGLRLFVFLNFFLPLSSPERKTHALHFMLVMLCSFLEILVTYVTYLFYTSMGALCGRELEMLKLLNYDDL